MMARDETKSRRRVVLPAIALCATVAAALMVGQAAVGADADARVPSERHVLEPAGGPTTAPGPEGTSVASDPGVAAEFALDFVAAPSACDPVLVTDWGQDLGALAGGIESQAGWACLYSMHLPDGTTLSTVAVDGKPHASYQEDAGLAPLAGSVSGSTVAVGDAMLVFAQVPAGARSTLSVDGSAVELPATGISADSAGREVVAALVPDRMVLGAVESDAS